MPPNAPQGTVIEKHGIRLRRFAGHALYTTHLQRPLRVAHLTDLHVGLVTPMRVQMGAVAIVNREKPDLVVITGDFVCHSHAYLEDLAEVLRAIEAPTFAVLGNHDYWAGALGVRRALKAAGVELLVNTNTVLEVGGQRLQIVGLDDAYTGHADRRAALRGLRRDLPALGLSHIAEEADALWAAGVPLVLSGHTHGGQLTVARLHELTLGRIGGHRYVHGLYGRRALAAQPDGAVYVGAGIGAAVLPLRVGDRGNREIAIFELGLDVGAIAEHHAEQSALNPASELDEERVRAERHARFQARRKRLFRAPRHG